MENGDLFHSIAIGRRLSVVCRIIYLVSCVYLSDALKLPLLSLLFLVLLCSIYGIELIVQLLIFYDDSVK